MAMPPAHGLQVGEPPRTLHEIEAIESLLCLPSFTSDTAWTIGNLLRTRLLATSRPVVISISLANNNQILFHTATRPGTAPDNDIWVARKRKTVLRWGVSSYYMHHKLNGDEQAFREKYMLGDDAGSYAIHGGGMPIRVKGVEGVVAVCVVSGLKQEEDHQVIVEVLQEYLKNGG